jgi:hypothetical protein
MQIKRFIVAICCIASLCLACGESPKKPQASNTPETEQNNESLQLESGVGLSLLAVQNSSYGCEWISAFDGIDTLYLAILWNSFGDRNDCLIRFLEDTRPKVLNVYLSNGSCERKKNCSEREVANPFRELPERALAVKELVQAHATNTRLIVTIGLEDNYLDLNAEYFCESIKRRDNAIEVWRNPVKADQLNNTNCFSGYELHHQEREADATRFRVACGYSNDGYDLEGIGIGEWALSNRIDTTALLDEIGNRKRDCISYIWSARASNCLRFDSGQSVAPHFRQCDFNRDVFSNLNQLLREANYER